MKKKTARLFSLALATVIAAGMFAGCSKKETAEPAKAAQTAQTPAQATPQASGKISDKPITLTYWGTIDNNSASVISNYADMEMYKQMEKISNIKMVFKHPPIGQEKEQFNLMIASRDLPDMVEYGWVSYSGGPEKAISDGIIVKLNDLIDKNAPTYKKLLEANPIIAKQARTDSKSLYAFPAIGMGYVKTSTGPLIRKDWLDDVGLTVPETLDEWTAALTQFKQKKGATAPITGTPDNFVANDVIAGAFGVNQNYYLDNGKVKYGPMEPAYKQYITLLRDWYKAGLLDPDFAGNNAKAIESKMTTNKSGILYSGGIGGTQGAYLAAMKDKDPKYNLVGLQYPVLKKGDAPLFTSRAWEVRTSGMVAITTANKYPAESSRWADYFYTDEGNLLKNFGVAGLTYNLVNGYPKYTDLIMNNPEKLSMNNALGKYMRASTPSPGLIDSRYHEQYMSLPQQQESMKLWAKVSDNSLKVYMPPVTATPQETEELSTITTTLDSYQKEMVTKFIMGAESLDNYDKFVDQLKKMKAERAVQLKQAALDRYNAR